MASQYDSIVENADYLQHESEFSSGGIFSIADSLDKKTISILDIGYGTGLLTRRLFQKGIPAVINGVDVSQEMLREVHKRKI